MYENWTRQLQRSIPFEPYDPRLSPLSLPLLHPIQKHVLHFTKESRKAQLSPPFKLPCSFLQVVDPRLSSQPDFPNVFHVSSRLPYQTVAGEELALARPGRVGELAGRERQPQQQHHHQASGASGAGDLPPIIVTVCASLRGTISSALLSPHYSPTMLVMGYVRSRAPSSLSLSPALPLLP